MAAAIESAPIEPAAVDPGRESRPPVAAWPSWVSFAVWGLRRRTSVLFFAWLSVLLALGLLWVGVWPGAVYFGCALWYWGAVRWIDRHGDWPLRRTRIGAARRSTLAA